MLYCPPHFREDDPERLREAIHRAGLAFLVTATAEGPFVTPLPLLLVDEGEGYGTLYGHLAKANPQWRVPPVGDALALFPGPDAYVSPSWYPSKTEHGRVVPTWNYTLVCAAGPVAFFDDPKRLLDVVSRLTDRHEGARDRPWSVDDAPPDFVRAQLRGIVGVRLSVTRLVGKRKLGQNRTPADRAGVAAALAQSPREAEREIARLVAGLDDGG